jgi:hypothetical protein
LPNSDNGKKPGEVESWTYQVLQKSKSVSYNFLLLGSFYEDFVGITVP